MNIPAVAENLIFIFFFNAGAVIPLPWTLETFLSFTKIDHRILVSQKMWP